MSIYVRHTDDLRSVAREIRDLTAGLEAPEHSTEEMVAYTVGARLKAASRMAEEMSDALLYRLTGPRSTARAELRSHSALAAAAAGTAQVMGSLAEALRQVAFLNEHANLPTFPDLADARDAAWNVIRDHVDEARAALHDTADQLETDARHLVQPPPRSAAAMPLAQRPPVAAPLATSVQRRPTL
ncbi:hypothetical protein [Streptomyces mashuensis]|uniref:hypothetical protein n=1 Tax=Streptomyces mashuensis TaxID=33904 RepID=UPI00167DC555|nr:hypothetical protein [Streptomyces mashuensis]